MNLHENPISYEYMTNFYKVTENWQGKNAYNVDNM